MTACPRRKNNKEAEGTEFGRDLLDAAKQMLAHVRGEKVLEGYTIAPPVDVKAIRKRAGMSQAVFANAFCLKRRTLQDWEQGRVQPDSAVRAYLTVIDRNPQLVISALRG